MKLGLFIYANDLETVWNAFLLGNYSLAVADEVTIFLLGKGVATEAIDTPIFDIAEQRQTFINGGGRLLACGTCLKIHGLAAAETYEVVTMKEAHQMIKESDKVLTF